MLMIEEREKIVEFGKKLITDGLTTGTGGNISIFNKGLGYFAISPSGIDYFKTKVEDIVIMDLDGKIIEGEKKPSSEHEMHRYVYLNHPQAGATVHCHSTYATVLSTLRMDLPASNYIIADVGDKVVKCSRYETFGTKELAQASMEAMGQRRACLQANHGQLTWGKDIESAFNLAMTLEQLCKIHVISLSAGKPQIIEDEKMDEVLEKFKTYGQKKRD